jgi:hypothetical protein
LTRLPAAIYTMNRDAVQSASTNEFIESPLGWSLAQRAAARRFIEHVSHEFRTPLTVIKEFGELLHEGLSGSLNAKQKEQIGAILHRADDICLLVDDLLDFSKLETDGLSVYRTSCRLDETIRQVARTFEDRAANKGIWLSLDLADDLPEVYCDAEKITRVLSNLLLHAVRSTPLAGQLSLAARTNAEQSQVVVCLQDQSDGELGDAGCAAPDEASLSAGRFSLGLNVARRLVDANLGTLVIAPRPEGGNTFSFSLPAADRGAIFERYLDHLGVSPAAASRVSLLVLSVNLAGNRRLARVMDEFVQGLTRSSDLVYQVSPERWLLAASANEREVSGISAAIQSRWSEANDYLPFVNLPELSIAHAGTWSAASGRNEFLGWLHVAGGLDSVVASAVDDSFHVDSHALATEESALTR